MFKISKIPFFIVLLAFILPWPISFELLYFFAWLPEVLALIFFIILVSFLSHKILISNTAIINLIFIFILIIHLSLQYLYVGGYGNPSLLSIFIVGAIFYFLFHFDVKKNFVKERIKEINFILLINIFFILIEIILIEGNFYKTLYTLSNGTYKLSFDDSFRVVPQSLLKNSQAASQISLLSVAFFMMLYFSRKRLSYSISINNIIIFLASINILIFYPTTTILLIGFGLLFPIFYIGAYYQGKLMRYFLPIIVISFYPLIYGELFYKLDPSLSSEKARQFLATVLNPYYVFIDLSYYQILWGLGSMKNLHHLGVISGDVGIMILLLQQGIVVVGFLILIYLAIAFRIFSYANNIFILKSEAYPFLWLGLTATLFAGIFLLSLIHYSISIDVGGRAFFSYLLAISIYALKILGSYCLNKKSKYPSLSFEN